MLWIFRSDFTNWSRKVGELFSWNAKTLKHIRTWIRLTISLTLQILRCIKKNAEIFLWNGKIIKILPILIWCELLSHHKIKNGPNTNTFREGDYLITRPGLGFKTLKRILHFNADKLLKKLLGGNCSKLSPMRRRGWFFESGCGGGFI